MIKISKYYLVRNLTNNSNEIWGYKQIQTLTDVLGVTLKQIGRRFGHFISIDGEFNNLNGDAVDVTTDPTSMYVKLLQTGSQFGVWNHKINNTIFDEYTVSLLHFDDSITKDEFFLDWKPLGVPELNDSSKFGKSIYFNKTNGIYIKDSSNLIEPSDNFTVDFWAKPETDTGTFFNTYNSKVGVNINTYGSWIKLDIYGNSLRFVGYSNDVNITYPFDYNTWHHFAVTYDGIKFKVYTDGEYKMEIERYPIKLGGIFSIGCHADLNQSSVENFKGCIDEFRISNIVRWTSDFTPPTAPYGV